jgi:hypothetical protein
MIINFKRSIFTDNINKHFITSYNQLLKNCNQGN